MRILLLVLLLFIPAQPQALLEPVTVKITGGDEMASALRAELVKTGKVAIRTRGADWNIFIDTTPTRELGCVGYGVAVYVSGQGKPGLLRSYAGVSYQAVARRIAKDLDGKFQTR